MSETADPAERANRPAALSDPQLVARCRGGDDAAWRELVDRFARYVYAIATQSFRFSEHDAHDVFQEVFSRVYEHLDEQRSAPSKNDLAARIELGHVPLCYY